MLNEELWMLSLLFIQHSTSTFSTLFYVVQTAKIGDAQLEEGLSLELVLLEREGEIDPGAVAIEELGALGGPPGDRAETPAVLAERHLEVPVLDRPGPIDDLGGPGVEDGTRVGEAEGTERVEAADEIRRDAPQAERTVDTQARAELV